MEDKYQIYDTAITKTIINLMSFAKRNNNEIGIGPFDYKNPSHLYLFKVAGIVSQVHNTKVILEMNFWEHLFSSKEIRRTAYKKNLETAIDPEKFLEFTFDGLNCNPAEIYEEYYK